MILSGVFIGEPSKKARTSERQSLLIWLSPIEDEYDINYSWISPWYCAHWEKIPLNKKTGPNTGDETDVFWSAQFGHITIKMFAAKVTFSTPKIIIWTLSYGLSISTVPSVLKEGSVASFCRFKNYPTVIPPNKKFRFEIVPRLKIGCICELWSSIVVSSPVRPDLFSIDLVIVDLLLLNILILNHIHDISSTMKL